MLQIKEWDFVNIDLTLKKNIDNVDKEIKSELVQLKDCLIPNLKVFFSSLEKVISLNINFLDSFVLADFKTIEKLKKLDPKNFTFKRKELINDKNVIQLQKQLKDKNLCSKLKNDINKQLNEIINLNNYLDSIFKYDTKKSNLIQFFSQKDENNCYYCLAQHTTIYDGKEKLYLKGNLDHIFPQSENALLSMSLNNLIPICSHCNQRKSNAKGNDFNFNPFDSEYSPIFKFDKVLYIKNGEINFNNLKELKIDNINSSLEKRLELTLLYSEFKSPIINLLNRYKKFNSKSYKEQIENLLKSDTSNNGLFESLEYFISEIPYTEENIQNIPLHKFKSDFYKELEQYKSTGEI